MVGGVGDLYDLGRREYSRSCLEENREACNAVMFKVDLGGLACRCFVVTWISVNDRPPALTSPYSACGKISVLTEAIGSAPILIDISKLPSYGQST